MHNASQNFAKTHHQLFLVILLTQKRLTD